QLGAAAGVRRGAGAWGGDHDAGWGSRAPGTAGERPRPATTLLCLPRLASYGHGARTKNGPALAGHGAEAVRDAITRAIITLPEQLRRSRTWDRGAELSQHAHLRIEA